MRKPAIFGDAPRGLPAISLKDMKRTSDPERAYTAPMADNVLLSVEEMYGADALAVAGGVASLDLMEAAGAAIASEIQDRWQPRPVCVLAGPGNNGGDGFVTARLLAGAGWPVRLALLGGKDTLKGDAFVNAGLWDGDIENLDPAVLDDRPLVVDALFGAGLTRPLDGSALTCIQRVNEDGLDCLCVDIPSGVHGDSGPDIIKTVRCAGYMFTPKVSVK